MKVECREISNIKIMCIIISILLCLLARGESRPARPESLPKIVWTYQENVDNNFIHTLCLQRMRSVLADSRWVLEVLTPSNIFIYLHQHQEYKLMLRNNRNHLEFCQEIQIVKLLILQEYGGLWIDPDIIMLQSVEWIHHLSSENDIINYGNSVYETVLFSAINQSQHQLQGSKQTNYFQHASINLGIILSLKQSPFIVKLVKQLSKELQKEADLGQNEEENIIKSVSLKIITNLLKQAQVTVQNKLKDYKIWNLKYIDTLYSFSAYANTRNPYILANFYIKYPLTVIENNFESSNRFISLSYVSQSLNEILNPNISKLSYLNKIQYLKFLCTQQIKCAHYLQSTSVIYTFLLKHTHFQRQFQDLVKKDDQIFSECNYVNNIQWIKEAFIVIYYTICILVLYLAAKIQKICVQLLWVKTKIFLRPRIMLMVSIFKTVKNVIQYSRNEI